MAKLIQRGPKGTQEHLFGGSLRVGRDKGLDIPLDDGRCSREHTLFYVAEQDGRRRYWVRDLESRNGTYLNGRKLLSPAELSAGDIVKVGGSDFVFQPDPGEAVAAPPKPAAPPTPAPAKAPESPAPRVSRASAAAPSPLVGLLRAAVLLLVFSASTYGTKLAASLYIASLFR